MDDYGRRSARIAFLTLVAAVVGFGLSLAKGLSLESALLMGGISGALLLTLVWLLFWRP